MKQVKYTDNTPSREIDDDEDDWEAEGGEEANDIYEACRIGDKPNLTFLRDDLNNLQDLVGVCADALINWQNSGQRRSQERVGNVLLLYVLPILSGIEEELKHV